MDKKEKRGINYYKYATFVLVALLVVTGMLYAFGTYKNSVFNDGFSSGQMNAVGAMIDTLNKEGSVTFTNGNTSLTLVPAQQIQLAREQTIMDIMNFIRKEGYVSLYNNESEMILVEYQQPEAPSNSLSMDAMIPSDSEGN